MALVVATYASAGVIVVASLLLGRAILLALGRERASYLEGAVGIAVLLVVCSIAIRLPGEGNTSVAITGVILLASLIYLAVRREAILGPAVAVAAPAALLALFLASIPFIASDHIGVPGVGVNNDMAAHLLYADYLQDPGGPTPRGVDIGYPIGPHALAATMAERLGIEPLRALLGLLIAVPVLTAIASLAFLREMPPLRRTLIAGFVAVPYLAAATFGIAGFKELLAGLFLVAVALGLRDISRGEPGRNAIVVGIAALTGGTVAAYSFPGLAWPLAAIGAWAVAELARARIDGPPGAVSALVRRAAPTVLTAGGILLILALIQLPRTIDFLNSDVVSFVRETDSKLRFTVSPLEALGAWPSGDAELGTSDVSSYWIFGAIGVLALGFGLYWWVRNRDLALPAAVAGAAIVYLGILVTGGRYAEAKALAVPASLIMLFILGGLFARDGGWPRRVLAVAFVAVAAYSSFLALRDTVIAPPTRFDELSDLRGEVEGERVLSLTSDRFADYGLRGAEVFSPARNAEERVEARPSKDQRLPVDFDTPLPEVLNDFPFAVTTSAYYQSRTPPGWEKARETDSYILWRRIGETPPNLDDLNEEARPGRIFRCGDAKFAPLLDEPGEATVLTPRPVIAKRLYWDPSEELAGGGGRAAVLEPGESAMQTMTLPPGRWELSLQYGSPASDVTLTAPSIGYQQTLPAGVEAAIPFRPDQGPYWRAGQIESDGRKIDFTVHAEKLNRLQRLLGVDAPAIIGNLTAIQLAGVKTQPLRDSCQEFVDHFVHTVPGDFINPRELEKGNAGGKSSQPGKSKAPE